MKILVIGGTGTVGGALVARLLARGDVPRVLTRSAAKSASLPAGAEGAVGDMADPASLAAAMDGVDAVFLVVPVDREETRLGLNAVGAAKSAKVGRLVFMSVFGAETAPEVPHFIGKLPIEEAVRASGLPSTILRPGYFFQNEEQLAPAIAKGLYPQPIGEVGLSGIDVGDIADAAVNALTAPGHEGRTIPLVGLDLLTGPTVAATYAKHLGHAVRYGGDDLVKWCDSVAEHMPDWLVADLCAMYAHFLRHGLRATDADREATRRVLGREPRRFDDFAAEPGRATGDPAAGDSLAFCRNRPRAEGGKCIGEQRAVVSLMATGFRRDGLGTGNGQEATLIGDPPCR